MYIKYSDKIELNKKKLINNKTKPYINDDNNNYFLKEEDLELPTFQKNNYQSQFINKKLFSSNSKNNKNKYILNFEHYNNEEKKTKENNYFSNNSNLQKNIDNYFNNDSLTENFENLKKMNNNINDILSNMKKEIRSSSKKKNEEIQNKEEVEVLLNFDKYNNKNINELNQNKNNINKLDNELEFKNSEPKFKEFMINDFIKTTNIPKKIYTIDKNEQNQINIKGIKQQQKDLINIKTNEFSKEIENKLNSIYGKNKNKMINVDKLINDLYEYKIKYENLKLMVNSKDIEKTKKEINDNLSKLKKENYKLNLQKKFLINELTKSIYNNENLRNKYKNELERFDSYLNKIKYDLKEKAIDI